MALEVGRPVPHHFDTTPPPSNTNRLLAWLCRWGGDAGTLFTRTRRGFETTHRGRRPLL